MSASLQFYRLVKVETSRETSTKVASIWLYIYTAIYIISKNLRFQIFDK